MMTYCIRLVAHVCLPAIFASLLILRAGMAADADLPLVFSDNFEKGADRWEPTDPKAWKVTQIDGKRVYDQHKKRSSYNPPHRSPYNISLVKDVYVGDFVLDARVRSTHPDYGHRDVCLFFGYQDAGHFYYVHLGKKTDAHANQIFVVDGKPRTKISTKTTAGTNWDDAWHDVRITRDVEQGTIRVFFDDMETPIMVARDKTFVWGRFGVGSFDDTSQWDSVRVTGKRVERPNGSASQSG